MSEFTNLEELTQRMVCCFLAYTNTEIKGKGNKARPSCGSLGGERQTIKEEIK